MTAHTRETIKRLLLKKIRDEIRWTEVFESLGEDPQYLSYNLFSKITDVDVIAYNDRMDVVVDTWAGPHKFTISVKGGMN